MTRWYVFLDGLGVIGILDRDLYNQRLSRYLIGAPSAKRDVLVQKLFNKASIQISEKSKIID
jgi:hypothetical protein